MLVSFSAALILASISRAQNPTLLLQHVNVIDVTTSAPRKAVDVLIRGGRIDTIASHVSRPHGSIVVPANGKFLIPGLWDMHVHVWDAGLAFPLITDQHRIRKHVPLWCAVDDSL